MYKNQRHPLLKLLNNGKNGNSDTSNDVDKPTMTLKIKTATTPPVTTAATTKTEATATWTALQGKKIMGTTTTVQSYESKA